jgi:hypothetical protein
MDGVLAQFWNSLLVIFPAGRCASPLSVRCPATISPQIQTEDRDANKDSAANHDPLRQVGIHNSIKHTHEKWSVCRFDACASFKPRFSYGERARRPRNQLNDDGVDERSDMQCPQKRAVARSYPAQQHPAAPQQVQEQNSLRENRCRGNGWLPLCCWVQANYPLNRKRWAGESREATREPDAGTCR